MKEKEARELLEMAEMSKENIDDIITNAKRLNIVDFSFKEQFIQIIKEASTEVIDEDLFHKLESLTEKILLELEVYENKK